MNPVITEKLCKGSCGEILDIEKFARYHTRTSKRRVTCIKCEIDKDLNSSVEDISEKRKRRDYGHLSGDSIYC